MRPGALFFGDVAGGPGGFSEYVLWRRGGSAKGFGFTLRGDHDFKAHGFHYAASPEVFHRYYGVSADGDLYRSDNLRALQAPFAAHSQPHFRSRSRIRSRICSPIRSRIRSRSRSRIRSRCLF